MGGAGPQRGCAAGSTAAVLLLRPGRAASYLPAACTASPVLSRASRTTHRLLILLLRRAAGEIVVATTRPETMLGDTAVAVHPEDPRWVGRG